MANRQNKFFYLKNGSTSATAYVEHPIRSCYTLCPTITDILSTLSSPPYYVFIHPRTHIIVPATPSAPHVSLPGIHCSWNPVPSTLYSLHTLKSNVLLQIEYEGRIALGDFCFYLRGLLLLLMILGVREEV